MIKISLLAASIALVLSGCGDGDDTYSITAIDGYLANADIYVGEKCDTKAGVTDANGIANLNQQYMGLKLCVMAVKGQTIDSDRGIVTKDFTLRAPADATIINPMTHLVVEKMDTGLSITEAQAEVLAQFEVLQATPEQLFGDYIKAANNGDTTAQGLKVIAETLVDAQVEDNEFVDEFLDVLIADVKDMIDANESLEGFDPVIDAGGITVNYRPIITLTDDEQDKFEEYVLVLGESVRIDVSKIFADVGDTFTLSIMAKNGAYLPDLGLAFNPRTGLLTGTPIRAGEIELHVYATDSHGARSYPLEIEIDVNSPNSAPVVDSVEKVELETELAELALTQGIAVDTVIDLDDLFEDKDDDSLKLTVATSLKGIIANIEQEDDLRLTGTPSQHGTFSITVTADDGIHATVSTKLTVAVADNGAVAPEPSHPLVGTTWYMLESGNDDGDDNDGIHYPRVWCDTYKFEEGNIYFNKRNINNLTECSSDATDLVGSYTVHGDELSARFVTEDGQTQRTAITSTPARDGIAEGAQLVNIYGGRTTFFAKADDAEQRIGIESDGSANERNFTFELPVSGSSNYALAEITLATNDVGDDVYMYFDVPGKDYTCNVLRNVYFLSLTAEGMTSYPFFTDASDEDVNYCVATFMLPTAATVGAVYSINASVIKTSDKALIEPIRANIEWTGEYDNE